jgi:hypothetical protein
LDPALKAEVQQVAQAVLETNGDCQRQVDRFVDAVAKPMAFSLRRLERETERSVNQAEWRRQLANNLVVELFGFLSRQNNAAANRQGRMRRGHALSKQAKKEIVIKLSGSDGLDWDRES